MPLGILFGRVLLLILLSVFTSSLWADWPMAAANPQRTSWVPEQVPDAETIRTTGAGRLHPQWYRPIEPFIPGRVQVIAAHNLLYVSTARGLYAFKEDGALAWIYPTELPLGHSPTIHEGVAYVGCFDGRIHAVNARTGELLGLSPQAGAGFQTNPLVVGGTVYAGNRDGRFYAWRLGLPDWVWTFPSANQEPLDGPILFSAAYDDEYNLIYFAANDGHAYALHADGRLAWRSAKLPGQGFHSWWPVIHGDTVIFAGSDPRRSMMSPAQNMPDIFGLQQEYFFSKGLPKGTVRSPRSQDGWLDTSKPVQSPYGLIRSNSDYFEDHPDHRTYIVLSRTNGREITYDFDNDGKPEYAPILFWGTHSGNRYPPVVGKDGTLYQSNLYFSDDWIPGGHISGWRLHTPFISTPVSRWLATDEPVAYSSGGNLIYWNHCCDRSSGAADLSRPNNSFPVEDQTREWWYYSYNIDSLMPGYNIMADGVVLSPYSGLPDCPGPFGGRNGVYHFHGEQNPPIPYNGKLYSHRSNALLAFGVPQVTPASLPVASAPVSANRTAVPLSSSELLSRLKEQVERILNAGHLLPGWGDHGLLDGALSNSCGDQFSDYWRHPADIHIAMLQTLPHLPPETQQRVKEYLAREMRDFPPDTLTSIGWADGAPRGVFESAVLDTLPKPLPGPSAWSSNSFSGWTAAEPGGPRTPPYFFYALWKYAEVMGGARELFDRNRERLPPIPADEILTQFPFVHNAYIAGYLGYLELARLAGYQEPIEIRQRLDRLLERRVMWFSKDTPYTTDPIHGRDGACRVLSVSRNFIFLTPELAGYLRSHAMEKVAAALEEYERVAPYWFVAFAEMGAGENTFAPLYDRLLFFAKAWVLGAPRPELTKYLDIPAFPVGDLFYLQMLVAALEAPSAGSEEPYGLRPRAGPTRPMPVAPRTRY